MLFSLLSIVAMTLAYPHPDTEGSKLLLDATSNSSTFAPIQKNIATNLMESIEDDDKCYCMPYYLCDGPIKEDTYSDRRCFRHDSTECTCQYNVMKRTLCSLRGSISTRLCDSYLELCCKNPIPKQLTTPIPKAERGCGYRDPQGLHSFPSQNSKTSGETPWVVALMVGNTAVGAGALVHPQVVLTAAHVANNYFNDTLIVRAGEWHTQTDKRLKGQDRTVERKKIHQNFNKNNLMNDIALLYLQEPMKLADHINVICLPDQDEDFDYSRGCIVNGWEKNNSGAVTLKKVEADILDSASCEAKLKLTRLSKWFNLHRSFVCAQERQGFTCKGDGGAPLVCPGAEAYKVCGLVAWGIGCGDDVPSVYARVSMFREWIDDSMREFGFGADEWV